MASFADLLRRVQKSIDRNNASLRDVNEQLALCRSRGGPLVVRLEAHAKRIAGVLGTLEQEKATLCELVKKSPELPLGGAKGR